MASKNYHALAAELLDRLPKNVMETMNVRVWVDESDCDCIHCAPEVGDASGWGYGGYILYVKEIVLFAQYHDLDVSTKVYQTGAGLCLS